jgi:Holliday junction resolvase-like predicted endonuclease
MKVKYDAVLFVEVPKRRGARRSWKAVEEINDTRKRQAIRDARRLLARYRDSEAAGPYQVCVYEVRADGSQSLIYQAHLRGGRITIDEL